MIDWKSLVPEICPHGVDQRYKFSTETFEDGATLSRMDRNWCCQCLGEIDFEACLKILRGNDV
jgi:hypothetical protein